MRLIIDDKDRFIFNDKIEMIKFLNDLLVEYETDNIKFNLKLEIKN